MRKFLSLLLSTVLCLSLGTVAFAADTDLGTTYIDADATSVTLDLDGLEENYFYGLGSLRWGSESQVLEIRTDENGKIVIAIPAGWTVRSETPLAVAIPGLGTAYVSVAESCVHEWGSWTVSKAATCTAPGWETRTCAKCGATQTREISALGHTWGDWVITVPATEITNGIRVRECSVCHAQETETLPATGTGNGSGTVGGGEVVAVQPPYQTKDTGSTENVDTENTTEPDNTSDNTEPDTSDTPVTEPEWTGFFTDVPNDAYYYDAVQWAVAEGITNGVTENLFAPEQTCTRAQMVTFLWRAAGSPAVVAENSPFDDIPSGAYYADAVQWAAAEGITTGTSATTFSPDRTVTRSQVVTFLWRAAGSPAVVAENSPFDDIPSGAYYADAVQWAAAMGITTGTSATMFSPDAGCTRGQIVTFLYRAINA